MRLMRWWRERGHNTNDVWCIYWVNHCRGPVARCPKCAATGGYFAVRKAQADADAALRAAGTASTAALTTSEPGQRDGGDS